MRSGCFDELSARPTATVDAGGRCVDVEGGGRRQRSQRNRRLSRRKRAGYLGGAREVVDQPEIVDAHFASRSSSSRSSSIIGRTRFLKLGISTAALDGFAKVLLDCFVQARALGAGERLPVGREMGNGRGARPLAATAAARAEPVRAGRLWGALEALEQQLGLPSSLPPWLPTYSARISTVAGERVRERVELRVAAWSWTKRSTMRYRRQSTPAHRFEAETVSDPSGRGRKLARASHRKGRER